MDALSEFKSLAQNQLYSMPKIEWWLLKYSEEQKTIYDFIYGQHLFQLEDGSTVRLPKSGKYSDHHKFLNLYEALDTLSQFHRNEKYFEEELILFHQIKNSPFQLKHWLSKNEDLGANEYVCFFLDYLNYDLEEKVEHLSIFVLGVKGYRIYVDREEFRNTIEFLEIFNELYWDQENLPETLACEEKTEPKKALDTDEQSGYIEDFDTKQNWDDINRKLL